jgi:Ca-activated chloride channel family protein
MTMRTPPLLPLFLGLSTTLGLGAPRQGPQQPLVLSVKTDLVTLPVTVVDRRGAFVSGLAREHFTVYDNGEPRAIQLFTSEDVPATVGLVIDSSGSMRGRREAMTTAVLAFARTSHPLDELFTVHFNEKVWLGLAPRTPFTKDGDQLRAALASRPAEGMTALYDGIDRALDHLQRGTRERKALIVVSDGGDNASWRSLDAVLDRARRTNVAIYAVALSGPEGEGARPQVLKKLARETGGEVFSPERAGDVTKAFAQIAREIRSGYTIGFVPVETADQRFRTIRVVADAGDRRQFIVRTRAGYYSGPSGRKDS